jgi:16S rRNA G966 N2-methylase RsmD
VAGLRVIGGEAKGRRLKAPSLPGVRPTSDRVREAIFDLLEARGLVEGAAVGDLFAGTGALGIEALSRGAASVVFVESDPRAARVIEENLALLGSLGDSGRVLRQDVLAWLGGPGRRDQAGSTPGAAARGRSASGSGAGAPAPGLGPRLDVALVDPPYRFEGWPDLLERLSSVTRTAVLEHSRPLEVGPHFETIRLYRHGGTLLTLVRVAVPPGAE